MTNKQLDADDMQAWKDLVEKHLAAASAGRDASANAEFTRTLRDFLSGSVDRVAVVRNALLTDRTASAFFVAGHMDVSELIELFDEWVDWAATSHGYAEAVRDIIKRLPREWVLERIEASAEPYLRNGTNGTYDEYRRLLETYSELGAHNLVLKLAQRAAKDDDPDIREAGEDFLLRDSSRD